VIKNLFNAKRNLYKNLNLLAQEKRRIDSTLLVWIDSDDHRVEFWKWESIHSSTEEFPSERTGFWQTQLQPAVNLPVNVEFIFVSD
jgi:hypothetical protein